MRWNAEARKALSRVPFFVRHKVKRRIEEEAAGRGDALVTIKHVRDSQKNFVDRMEEEVQGYRVETCFGQGGCSNRALECDGLAEQLEGRLSGRDLKNFLRKKVGGPLKMHHEFRISISDCPNACSRPQIVDLGLIGASEPEISGEPCSDCGSCIDVCRENAILLEDDSPRIDKDRCLCCGQCIRACPTGTLQAGRKGYRILAGGKLGRHPRLAKELTGICSVDDAVAIADQCLDFYLDHCRNGERFGAILEREGEGKLRAKLERKRKTSNI